MISANISKEVRREVYLRDGYACALCDSRETIQIHHYVPRSRGGTNDPMNLITLCWECHNAVHGGYTAPGYPTKEEIEQNILEYLADYYLEEWRAWE